MCEVHTLRSPLFLASHAYLMSTKDSCLAQCGEMSDQLKGTIDDILGHSRGAFQGPMLGQHVYWVIAVASVVWMTSTPNYQVLVLSDHNLRAGCVRRMIMTLVCNMGMLSSIQRRNEGTVALTNGSAIHFRQTNDECRGMGCNALFLPRFHDHKEQQLRDVAVSMLCVKNTRMYAFSIAQRPLDEMKTRLLDFLAKASGVEKRMAEMSMSNL